MWAGLSSPANLNPTETTRGWKAPPTTENFQRLENSTGSFSRHWTISRKIFQGLEKNVRNFPSLGKLLMGA
jgi:hypothetical protein